MTRRFEASWLRPARRCGAIALACLLAACATPQASPLLLGLPPHPAADDGVGAQAGPGGVPERAMISNVPFFAQAQYQCGPAALAMLARHAGRPLVPEDLTAQVYVPGRQGSFQVEMLAAARRQGLLAYTLQPRLEDVLREVAAGHPVLVFQNLSLAAFPVWHYAVVVGFDRRRNVLVLHSGETKALEMSLFTFERTWARGGHWSMVATPPQVLPASAQPAPYLVAAAALERTQPAAAEVAYETALKAWPGQRAALLGWGNAAYAMGQVQAAASRFESATRQYPDFSEAWNNLAQVRLELGRLSGSREAAARAVSLGGARVATYQKLLDQIDAAIGSP